MARRFAIALAVACVVCLGLASAASAASATSWRATILGSHLHGGLTALIADGRGTLNVTLSGATPGQPVAVSVAEASCPAVGSSLISFLTSTATPSGMATAKLSLSRAQVTAFNADLSARTPLSILAFAPGDTGCGNLTGAPAVGTGRLRASQPGVSSYDVRYPVVSGTDSTVAASVNAVLHGDAETKAAKFVADAAAALRAVGADDALQDATQTFRVTLARPGILTP